MSRPLDGFGQDPTLTMLDRLRLVEEAQERLGRITPETLLSSQISSEVARLAEMESARRLQLMGSLPNAVTASLTDPTMARLARLTTSAPQWAGPAFDRLGLEAARMAELSAWPNRDWLKGEQPIDLYRAQRLLDRSASDPSWDSVVRAALLTHELRIPDPLAEFRSSIETLSDRLSLTGTHWLEDRSYLEAFGQASAFADMVASATSASTQLLEAQRTILLEPVPMVALHEYRELLDRAGLVLPRWPGRRLLTPGESRRRHQARLRQATPPAHVLQGVSLTQRNEAILRDVFDSAFIEVYGEEWPEARLPLCDCKDLLGKWRKRGGSALSHADFAHYSKMAQHPDHYEHLFFRGFADPDELGALLVRAGALRARSHHPHDPSRRFTVADLRELRVVWNTIFTGLNALETETYIIE